MGKDTARYICENQGLQQGHGLCLQLIIWVVMMTATAR